MNQLLHVTAAEAATEEALIDRARAAVGLEAWTVGECASIWVQRYARGRTDQEFALSWGLSENRFGSQKGLRNVQRSSTRDRLKWSFFHVALTWDDADECLEWAADVEATVAEMRAWRRAKRGDDLFAEVDSPVSPPAEVQAKSETAQSEQQISSGKESSTTDSMATVRQQALKPIRHSSPRNESQGRRERKRRMQMSRSLMTPIGSRMR